MCYPLLNSHKVKGMSKCLCPSPPWAYKIIHLLLLPMWFFFQLVNCYNDNLDKVGFNTNVTIRTVKRLLMFRTEFWTFETKKKKTKQKQKLTFGVPDNRDGESSPEKYRCRLSSSISVASESRSIFTLCLVKPHIQTPF